jgi:hypothetical protein
MYIKYETFDGSPSFVENNDLGHKWNKMGQQHYFRKGLDVLWPKFVFSYKWILELLFCDMLWKMHIIV